MRGVGAWSEEGYERQVARGEREALARIRDRLERRAADEADPVWRHLWRAAALRLAEGA